MSMSKAEIVSLSTPCTCAASTRFRYVVGLGYLPTASTQELNGLGHNLGRLAALALVVESMHDVGVLGAGAAVSGTFLEIRDGSGVGTVLSVVLDLEEGHGVLGLTEH